MALHRELSGRYVIVFTPRPSLLYWLVRRFFTRIGKWLYPDEWPMAADEIAALGRECGLVPIKSTKHIWENGVLFEVGRR